MIMNDFVVYFNGKKMIKKSVEDIYFSNFHWIWKRLLSQVPRKLLQESSLGSCICHEYKHNEHDWFHLSSHSLKLNIYINKDNVRIIVQEMLIKLTSNFQFTSFFFVINTSFTITIQFRIQWARHIIMVLICKKT